MLDRNGRKKTGDEINACTGKNSSRNRPDRNRNHEIHIRKWRDEKFLDIRRPSRKKKRGAGIGISILNQIKSNKARHHEYKVGESAHILDSFPQSKAKNKNK